MAAVVPVVLVVLAACWLVAVPAVSVARVVPVRLLWRRAGSVVWAGPAVTAGPADPAPCC
ncbi:hypothetical protein AWC22_23160 [Mycobacterium riyadhense]|uniref:Uncharacterized protein n=1 Tax=Mycobacterium riyadhense TaxID=486698 RepID=A0A1X2CFP0_9MYCO|nr:hypothetical protein AWC22_23160 [Mycobacterium riyadhense]